MRSQDDVARGAPQGDLAEAPDWLDRARWFAALAGLLSGLAAFGIGEATYTRIPAEKVLLNRRGPVAPASRVARHPVADVRNGAFAFGVLGLCLGGSLGIAGGLSRRSPSSTVKAGVLGSALGAGLAAGVSLVSLKLFADARVAYPDHAIPISMAMHGLTWGLAGAAGGLAFAVGLGQRRLLIRATMAGLAGAVLGAFAFGLAGASLFPMADTGDPVSPIWPFRLVARLWVTAATAACVILVLPRPPRGCSSAKERPESVQDPRLFPLPCAPSRMRTNRQPRFHQGAAPAMSRSRCFPSRLAFVMVAAFGMASINSPLFAQLGGSGGFRTGIQRPPSAVKLKEPLASRVYQRDVNGRAEIPIVLDESQKDAKLLDASLTGPNMGMMGIKFVDGKLVGVPTGGPYTINVRVADGNRISNGTVGPIFVGDLWVLAGQSNMEGVGDLIDVTPPHQQVMMLGMDGKWSQAEEPLHWLVDSPDPVHSGDAKTRADRSAQTHKTRKKGAGLGLPFAAAMVEATGVPIGLVACAHGGTSMEQWDPAKKDQGGKSLYGSMIRQVKLAGGKVKGVLWYQGESDAMGGDAWKSYSQVFSRFIAAVRGDFGQPELPFYFVQIGRFVLAGESKGWNSVQEAQRLLPERVPNTAVISVIDLELDDLIHVGTQGLKRAGQRLARIAERELFGQVGASTPTFERVTKGSPNTLVVKFKGVNMGTPGPYRGRPMTGMMGGMGGPGGMAATMNPVSPFSLGESAGIGLKPDRHIAGFSIRKEDGAEIPMIFEACVGKARDTVVLKLVGPPPAKSALWYGHGLDPYCNLIDGMDMAVPVFGPVPLDEVAGAEPATLVAAAPAGPQNRPQGNNQSAGQTSNQTAASLTVVRSVPWSSRATTWAHTSGRKPARR